MATTSATPTTSRTPFPTEPEECFADQRCSSTHGQAQDLRRRTPQRRAPRRARRISREGARGRAFVEGTEFAQGHHCEAGGECGGRRGRLTKVVGSGRKLGVLVAVASMAAVVVLSNVLVQHPFEFTLGRLDLADLLTWGAFSYPLAFLVTDPRTGCSALASQDGSSISVLRSQLSSRYGLRRRGSQSPRALPS